jgi:hypothetical protein
MSGRALIWIAVISIVGLASFVFIQQRFQQRGILIQGAVLIQDTDPRKQLPIPNVAITATLGDATVQTKSDTTGSFKLTLHGLLWRKETAQLQFRHPGYQPLDITEQLSNQIYVIRMRAVPVKTVAAPSGPPTVLKDVRVRYATKTTTPIDVGSVAKTFEVTNAGDVPCNGAASCSPDGKWKAAIGGLTLDAGEGHEFRNTRVSCIAGPCPFAKIDSNELSRGGRVMKVSARDWSDTVTFLVEAEVLQTIPSDLIRDAYPIIFGQEMSFTLPAAAEGPSIEADLNGNEIVFPLGPALQLSWAICNLQVGADRTKLYRCELKPGYRFDVDGEQ